MPPASFLYAEHEGAQALVHAYLATDYNDARLLSVGGPAEAVRAVLAALASTYSVSLFRRQGTNRQPAGVLRPESCKWRLAARRLPCGQIHGLLYPNTSVAAARDHFTLLLPRAQAPEASTHLLRLLDARTTLPLHTHWAAWLWALCDEAGWLTALHGEGDWIGWDVHWSESSLREQLTEAIQRRDLRVP